MEQLIMTPEKLEKFKEVYEANKDAESFVFDGIKFKPEYALDLIKQLEGEIT